MVIAKGLQGMRKVRGGARNRVRASVESRGMDGRDGGSSHEQRVHFQIAHLPAQKVFDVRQAIATGQPLSGIETDDPAAEEQESDQLEEEESDQADAHA